MRPLPHPLLGAAARGTARLLVVMAGLLGFPAVASDLGGAVTRLRVDQWGVQTGLLQGTVSAIAFDAGGDLWVGTFGGLHRFTGAGFEPVATSAEQRARYARVSALLPGEDDLWVGVLGAGLQRYDGLGYVAVDQPDALAGSKILALRPGAGGGLWVAADVGVWFRDGRGTWTRHWSMPALDVLELDGGTVFVATDDGLVVRWPGGEARTLLQGRSIYGLQADPGGNVWLQGLDGLWVWPAGAERPHETMLDAPGLFGVRPTVDGRGHLWLPTPDGIEDLGRWPEALASMLADRQRTPVPLETSTAPRALVTGPNGQVWVGTRGDGLVRVTDLPYARMTLPAPLGETALGPIVGAGDSAWVAADCSILLRLTRDGVAERRQVETDRATGHGCIRSLALDRAGGLWLGGRGALFRPEGETWRSVAPVGPAFGAEESVQLLVFDDAGGLWAGSSSGRLLRQSADGGLVDVALPSGAGVPMSIAFDGDRALVGTSEGLVVVDPSGSATLRTSADGLPHGPVRDVVLDATGVTWLVTYGGGLGWIDGDDIGRFDSDTIGMPDTFLSSVIPDPDGGLWLHGNRGLHLIRGADLHEAREAAVPLLVTRRFDVGGANGWNRPAYWLDDDHDLWAVTLDGILHFPLTVDHTPSVPVAARITEVRARDARFPIDDRSVTIPARLGRSVDLTFTASSLGVDDRPSYRHRLRAADDPGAPWSVPGPGTTARFAHLAPGTYTFDVQTVGRLAALGPMASVQVVIPSYWHERLGFWFLLASLALLFVSVAVGARLSVVGGRNRLLKGEVGQRRQAEERARRRQRQYRELFEAAGHGLLLFGADGRCTDANEEAERIFRVTSDVLVGMVRSDLGLDSASLQGIRCRRPDGSSFPARVATTRHIDAGVERVLVSVVDLSELLEAREAERRLRGQLESARRIESLGRLAGGVAHDMNNLLAAIIGNAELMQEENADPETGAPLDADFAEGLDEILDASARGARLVEQLMSMGRRDSSPPSDISLDDTLTAMGTMLRRVVPEDITLAVVAESALAVRATRAAIEQVVLNLVMNASDAMGSGGRLDVTSRASGDEGRVVLAVRDTGEGIPEELLDTIFEPFVTSKGPGQGTGLGLSTVRDIVTKLGGTISVQTTLGEGSEFTVDLPAVAVTAGATDLGPASPGEIGTVGLKVLVVDDNDALRRTVVGALRARDFDVVDFGDPVEALAWTRRVRPPLDVLVSDVVMPGLDGRSLADQIRETIPRLPVLFISGYTGDVVVRHGVDQLREALLRKPFSREALLSSVQAILREAGQAEGSGG